MLDLGYGFWSEWALQEKVDFDGVNKLIIVYPHVTELDIREDVWSAWVRWDYMLDRNYNRFLSAMERTGLDEIPGGQTGDMYFLVNEWKLVINLANVKVSGILYSRDFDTAYYTPELITQYPAKVSAIVNTVTVTENIIEGTPDEISAAVWASTDHNHDPDSHGALLHRLKYMGREIYIDTEADINGDGSQDSPFNIQSDAADAAEGLKINSLVVLADIELERQFKNFSVRGIGRPTISMNGQNLNKTEFHQCALEGNYTGRIEAYKCILLNDFYLNGGFNGCGTMQTLICQNDSNVVMNGCFNAKAGIYHTEISMNSGGFSNLSIHDGDGRYTITNCDNDLDIVSISMSNGHLIFDNTCTKGIMIALGNCEFDDLATAAGANVIDRTQPKTIVKKVVTYNGEYHV